MAYNGPDDHPGARVLARAAMADVMSYILKRRSIRAYADRPVERDQLVLLLQAAMAAPTAANSQPWEFVVVTDPTVLAELREHLIFGRYNAPAAIVVCGNPRIANNSAGRTRSTSSPSGWGFEVSPESPSPGRAG